MTFTTFSKIYLALLILAMQACSRSLVPTDPADGRVQVVEVPVAEEAPRPIPDWIFDGLRWTGQLTQYYTGNSFKLLWYEGVGLTQPGDSLFTLIGHLKYYGLRPQWYHREALYSSIGATGENDSLLRKDVLLSDALLSILTDVKYGRQSFDAPPEAFETMADWIGKIAYRKMGLHELISSREPVFGQYRALKSALRQMLDTIPSYNRRDLATDAYNKGATAQTITTIEVNLQRWRTERHMTEGEYVLVNIPSFMLRYCRNDYSEAAFRVIVGKPSTPTPIISSAIECITVYPYWHVPRKIAVEEYLPVIQKNPEFLELNRFDVLDRSGQVLNRDSVEWRKFNKNYFPVSLRQREGADNSLGLMKFHFDNPYAVYIHDTNARSLFNLKVRALSHGCIRVERPFQLAGILVRSENKVSQMNDCLSSKRRCVVDLPDAVPVFVRYFTCEFRDGRYVEFTDLYHRDEDVLKQMEGIESFDVEN